MQTFDPFDGAVLIDKPAGPTSHDVVDALRRAFRIEKVGHCGTLDPNATGLLIIVLGKGTKLSEKLMSDDKVYEGTVKFGACEPLTARSRSWAPGGVCRPETNQRGCPGS